MEFLYHLRRKLFPSRRPRWRPFRVVKTVSFIFAVVIAWGLWKWHVGDGSRRITRIAGAERAVFIAVSPSGDRLLAQAISYRPNGRRGYFIVDVKSGALTPIPLKTYPLRWSQDGKALLCIEHNEGLVWRDLASGREVKFSFGIPKPKAENSPPLINASPMPTYSFSSPSYNGEHITIIRSVNNSLHKVLWHKADGGEWEPFPVPYEMMPASDSSPGWSPGGKQFALEWFIPAKQERIRCLTVGTPNGEWKTYRVDAQASSLRWLKDDGTFLVTRAGRLDVLRLSQRSTRTIFRANNWQVQSTVPSPDGTMLALAEQPLEPRSVPPGFNAPPEDEKKQGRLFVVDEHGKVICKLFGTGCSAQWSPDGKTLYYGRGGDLRARRLR
jgi:hypothetical protein